MQFQTLIFDVLMTYPKTMVTKSMSLYQTILDIKYNKTTVFVYMHSN